MSDDRGRRKWYRRALVIPADLAAVLSLVALTNLLLDGTVAGGTIVRATIGLVFVLLLPGYALVAALFPAAGRPATAGEADTDGRGVAFGTAKARDETSLGLGGLGRVALAFGLSIALVPLLMIGLSVSPYEFALGPIVLILSAVTVAGAIIATVRRWALPPDRRFRVNYGRWATSGRAAITDADSGFDAVLNVALAAAVLVAVGTLAVGITAPQDAERFTEFYVLTENDSGELVTATVSEALVPGEPTTVYLGIENYEQELVEYTIVVQLQRIEGTDTSAEVVERAEIARYSTAVAHNETAITERELTVSDELTGEDLRLTYLLYDGSVPETPTRDNAYQSLHLWVDVGTDGG